MDAKFRQLNLEFALVSLSAMAFFCSFFGESFFTVFQARDLERVVQTWEGRLFLWGPETTGGGNLPGGFYYWLLSVPYGLFGDWRGAWYFMAFLNALAAGMLWRLLRRWGYFSAIAGIFLFLGSSANLLMFKSFWNPTCLPLFLFLTLGGLIRTYADATLKCRLSWFLSCLGLGLLLQLHLSTAPLVLAMLLLQAFGPSWKLERLPWPVWGQGMLLLLLTLAPYLLWLALYPDVRLGESPPDSAGRIRDSLPGVLSNPANLMLAPGLGAFLVRMPVAVWNLLPEPAWYMAGIAFGIAILKKLRPTIDGAHRVLFVCVGATFLSGAFYLFMPFGTRYALPFSNTAAIAVAALAGLVFTRAGYLGPALLGAAVILSCALGADSSWTYFAGLSPTIICVAILSTSGLAFSIWKKAGDPAAAAALAGLTLVLWLLPFDSGFARAIRGHFPINEEVEQASRFIFDSTGWSFESARRRIHLLNIHREVDIEYLYKTATAGRSPPIDFEQPDGFFITKPVTHLQLARAAALIRERNPPLELNSALKEGTLELLEPRLFGELAVLPFRWAEGAPGLISFHNIGYPVRPAPEDSALDAVATTPMVIKTNEHYLFVWNDCPGEPAYARTGLQARLKDGKLNVQILGGPLALPTPWTYPYCAQGWKAPFVSLECGGKIERHVIAQVIGLNWIEPPIAAETFLAPFEREFATACTQIDRIQAGRKFTKINNNGSISFVESKTLEFPGGQ